MMNDTLVIHTPADMVTTILFLFQMAILEVSISAWLVLAWEEKTHIRNTIKSEAVATPK